MKIFTRKQLRELEKQARQEMGDRYNANVRIENLERNIFEIANRIDRLEKRLDTNQKPVCEGTPKEVVNHG